MWVRELGFENLVSYVFFFFFLKRVKWEFCIFFIIVKWHLRLENEGKNGILLIFYNRFNGVIVKL